MKSIADNKDQFQFSGDKIAIYNSKDMNIDTNLHRQNSNLIPPQENWITVCSVTEKCL